MQRPNWDWKKIIIPQIGRKKPFERKERKSVLASQEYLELYATMTRAKEILKDITDESEALACRQKESESAYEVVRSELSIIATEKAMLEAEGNEIGKDLEERYQQAKISFVRVKNEYEAIKAVLVLGKEEAEQKLKLIQESLKTFLCAHEEELIEERKILEREKKEAFEYYIYVNDTIESIGNDLFQVMMALKVICGNNHVYENSINGDYEIFRCKRCGHKYSRHLPPMDKD